MPSGEEVAAPQQAQAPHRARREAHSVSTDSSRAPTDTMSGRDSRVSAVSQASASTQATYDSIYSGTLRSTSLTLPPLTEGTTRPRVSGTCRCLGTSPSPPSSK